jgi:autotransporter translocation and assembly factor TamB
VKFIFHIPLALILILLGAFAVTFYVVTQTTIVHRAVNTLLAQYIESKYNVKIDYGDIGGSLLEYITVDNVRVDFERVPHRYRLLKINRIEAYYNINNLWHGIWHLDSLFIDEPTLVLRSDSTGKVLIPELGSKGGSESKSSLRVAVDHFRLLNGRFQWFRMPHAYYADSITIMGSAALDKGDVRAAIDSIAVNYPQRSLHLKQLHFDVELANRMLRVDSLYLLTDSTRLAGGGTYPLDTSAAYTFTFSNSHISLGELSRVLGLGLNGDFDFSLKGSGKGAKFAGNVDADGTFFARRLGPLNTDYSFEDGVLSFTNLKGQAFDGELEGAIELNLVARPETYSGDLQVTGLNLDKIVPKTFKSRISGALEINGSGLGANSFNLDLNAKCGRGSFDFVNYDSLSGTISMNVTDMYFHPGFALNYKHSRFTAEGVVDYNGQMEINGDFTTSQLADFWGDLFIKKLSGGGRATYTVTGSDVDPDIRGVFYGDSCSFYGLMTDSLAATFDIKSFLYRRLGDTDIKIYKTKAWTLPADSIVASIKIDSNLVTINRANLYHRDYSMDGKAVAIIHDTTASLQLSDFAFTFDTLQYVNAGPIPVEFLADRIIVDSAQIESHEGRIGIYCNYGYDSTIVLRAETDSFVVAPWLRELHLDTLLTATLKMKGEMTGKLKAPKVTLEGMATGLEYGHTPLGALATKLSFQDSTISFDDLTLHFEGGYVTASGHFPLVMNFDSGLVYVPQRPMAMTMKSTGNDLSLLSSVSPNLETLTGDYQLQMDIYGTPQQPLTKGTFGLKNGSVKVYQLENPIENLQAQLTSQGKLVTLEWAEGKMRYKGKEGTVRAAGTIQIRSLQEFNYDLSVVGFDVPVKYDLGDIFGLCDAELQVSGALPPKVTGNVTVKEASYYDEFAAPEVSAAVEAADTIAAWDYAIQVTFLPGSVVVKNNDVNMIVDGELFVMRENAKDTYLGTLNINRGTYYLGDLNFQIGEGSQLVFDDIRVLNPTLNINATARLRNYTTDISSSSYNNLDLVIGGTLLEPRINSAPGSAYSDQDILTLILINQPASANRSDPFGATPLQNRIQVGGLGLLGNMLGQKLSRTFGVERIDLAPTYSGNNTVSGADISVGWYTLPNVYTYVSSLSLDGKAEYGAEYHLGRHFYFAGSLDRNKLWNLNLNLKWDIR